MNNSDDKQKKIETLDKRIQNAKDKNKLDTPNKILDAYEEEHPEAKKSARAGSEFLANIFAGAILGFTVDWYFGTKPWAMIIFILMGFVSGVYRANAAMKNTSEKNSK